MNKIITAIGNPILNQKLKLEKNIKVIGNDIQYQEGIFEILEKEYNINFLILSEIISGELPIEKLIEKIKLINKDIKLIVILEDKKEELENILISKGVFKILYNNQIEINDLIKFINNVENNYNENEELKKEINNLKKLIIENNKINNEKLKTNNLEKNNFDKKEFIQNKKIKNNKNNFNIIKKNRLLKRLNIFYNKKIKKEKVENNKKEIISVSGPSGVGKSIIAINLAKTIMYEKNKVLIIDFDILNKSLHTILGVRKYPIKTDKKIKNMSVDNLSLDSINVENLNIEDFVIKINKRIDLISATDILFNNKEKIDTIKLEKILNKLKEKYNTIIIDTSSECFFNFTKTIIKLSNKNIFVTETNILEIKKAKELLNIYINQWKIDKNKFNILFNKYDKNCININLLKNIFCEFNIIGTLRYNAKYNKLINKNIKNNFNDKKIRNEYLKIKNNI